MKKVTLVKSLIGCKPNQIATAKSLGLVKIGKSIEVETELAGVEAKIAEYDARFAVATEYNADEYKAYDELKSHYDHLMHEWEKASYEVEITEQQ